MNCLLIFPDELSGAGEVLLSGERARYAMETHALSNGIEIKAGVLDGRIGRAKILKASPSEVRGFLELISDPPARLKVDFVAAIPRPQTIKKVLHLAASAGVRSVNFVAAEKGVKSYIQSKTLGEEAIRSELILGLEQAGDTILPVVKIFGSLSSYFEHLDTSSDKALRLIGDSRGEKRLWEAVRSHSGSSKDGYILATGPEAGWSDKELERFARRGFEVFTLGSRMLRVEVALSWMLGELSASTL